MIKKDRENRAFLEMLKAAREWLAGRAPAGIAKRAGIEYNGKNLMIEDAVTVGQIIMEALVGIF